LWELKQISKINHACELMQTQTQINSVLFNVSDRTK